MMKCPKCNKAMKKVDDIEIGKFGKVKGYRCSCGYEEFNIEELDKIVRKSKLRKTELKAKVFKSGNSTAVRIPKEIARAYSLKPGAELKLKPEKDKIELKVKAP